MLTARTEEHGAVRQAVVELPRLAVAPPDRPVQVLLFFVLLAFCAAYLVSSFDERLDEFFRRIRNCQRVLLEKTTQESLGAAPAFAEVLVQFQVSQNINHQWA